MEALEQLTLVVAEVVAVILLALQVEVMVVQARLLFNTPVLKKQPEEQFHVFHVRHNIL